MKTKIKPITLVLCVAVVAALTLLIITSNGKRADGIESFDADISTVESVFVQNEAFSRLGIEASGGTDGYTETNDDIPSRDAVMTELLFPLADITIGMSVDDINHELDRSSIRWHKDYRRADFQTGIGFNVNMSGSKFWTGSIVSFKDEKVIGLVLSRRYPPRGNSLPPYRLDGWKPEDEIKVEPVKADISVVKDSVKTAFEQLRQGLGTSYERYVLRQDNSLSAMYVWRREDDIVYFRHSSFERYEEKGFYSYSLNIVPLDAKLPEPHPYKSDNEVHGPKLWLDAAED